MLSLFICEIV